MKQDKIKRGKKYRKGYHDGYEDGYEDGKTDNYHHHYYTQGYNYGRATGLQTALKDAYDIVNQTTDKETALQKLAQLQKAVKHETPHRPIRISP